MPITLVCLHGWGGTKESFAELREALKDDPVTVITPDLPGFGSEPEPDRPWTIDDYADWVVRWLRQNGKFILRQAQEENEKWLLLGHSHGGRIAIKLVTGKLQAARCPLPAHLFLCAAAGIRRPRHLKRIIGLTLAKTGKALLAVPVLRSLQPLGKKLLYKLVRVHDYENASPVMRQTLINVSREDLRPLLPSVSVPTDIVWGADDRMTPLADGRLMHAAIPGSRLHVFPGVRHRVHRDRAADIAALIRSSLAGA